MPDDSEQLSRFTYLRGRVALSAILRGLGIGKGDEVAIQAFTCVAVPEAVLSTGASPVYVDIEPDGINMDPVDLISRLTERTKAIVVQHTYGLPADLDRILAVSAPLGVHVIEDCAHALGCRWRGHSVGSFGIAGFHSFEASKPIVIGMGGAAITRDAELARRLQADYSRFCNPGILTQCQLLAMFAAHAIAYRPQTYWAVRSIFRAVVAAGIVKSNYNATGVGVEPSSDFTFRMGRAQRYLLRRALINVDLSISSRKAVGLQLRDRITCDGVHHVRVPPEAEPVFTRLPFFVGQKAELLALAPRMRVELADFYNTPVHPLQGAALQAVGYTAGSCPNAEMASSRVVSLPTNHFMVGGTLERAVDFVNNHA